MARVCTSSNFDFEMLPLPEDADDVVPLDGEDRTVCVRPCFLVYKSTPKLSTRMANTKCKLADRWQGFLEGGPAR